ncbi:MAG: ABC transporter permease [bacterium]|nr:ABC transporter permease [bacterium]
MFWQTIKMAFRALSLNKVRTALTMLGIIIGITSVIILVSAGQGAQSLIIGQIQGVGSNLIFILPGGSQKGEFSPPAASQGILVTTLSNQDIKAIRNPILAPSVQYVNPEVRGQFTVVYGNHDQQVSVAGDDDTYARVHNLEFSAGDWFSKSEVDGFTQVAVLGSKVKEDLFGARDPLGQIIKIKELSFRVVGVMKPKGVGVGGVDQDSQITVPVTTAQKILLGINYYNMVQVQVKDETYMESAQDEITKILRNNHHITDPNKDDFTIRNQKDILELLGTITSALTLFLGAIAGISLVVGGIGIMNIMLVSVTERTREIGLRKAIGAQRSDILLQFLLEAVTLTVIGGLIGIGFGYLGSIIIAHIGNWSPVVPLSGVALAFGGSALFGLVFGMYPAYKAAKLDPIQALRFE